MNEEFELLRLKDVIAIFQRWYKLAIYTFIGLIVPAVIVIFLILPMYEATASIWVNRLSPQANYSVGSYSSSATTTFRNLDRQEEISTYAEMIKSRIIVESMVDKLDLTMEKLNRIRDARRYVQAVMNDIMDGSRYVYNELKYMLGLSTRLSKQEIEFLKRVRLIDEIVDRISIDTLTESNVIGVSFRSSDPVLAKDAVNIIIDEFIHFYANMKELKAKTFFSDKSIEIGEELSLAEEELSLLQSETTHYSLEQQQGLLLNQLSEAEESLRVIEITKLQLNVKIAAYKEHLKKEPKKIIAREVTRKTPTGSINDRTTWEINPIYQELKTQLIKSEIEVNALKQHAQTANLMLGEYHTKLADMAKINLKINQLVRKIKRLEKNFERSVGNREEARISEEMSQASLSTVRVVDYAPYPLKPIRPRKLFYLLIALGASLLVSMAMPFLAYMNDSTISDENDIRRYLGIDFVSSFPRINYDGK